MSLPLRVGQVGVANFAAWRRQSLRETGLYKIVSVYDWNEALSQQAAQEEGAQACSSYEALLETPGLEAVIVSTGANAHAEQIIMALQRGLPVFVEKPLCATSGELAAILAAQRQYGLPIGVSHHNHETEAVSRTIKSLLHTGKLGQVVAIEKTTAHSGGRHIKPGDWRGDPDKNPGGMLFQCGVHALHELMFYFGPLTEIAARMRYDVHTTQTADAATCLLTFASGVIGTLNAYHITPYRHTLSIFGTDANLYCDARYFEEGTHLFTQPVRLNHTLEPHEPVVLQGENDPHGNLRAFYEAVRTGEMRYPSLFDGARAVAGVFAAEEAAKTGCTVSVPQFI